MIKIHTWFANRRRRKNDSLTERETTRLNHNKNSQNDSFSTKPSDSENHVFDQNINDLASKHQLNIDVDDDVLLPNKKTSVIDNEFHQTTSKFGKDINSCSPQFTNENKNNLMTGLNDNCETSVFVDSTIETPKDNDLFTCEDLDDLIGDTSLFPEVFNDSCSSLFVAKHD